MHKVDDNLNKLATGHQLKYILLADRQLGMKHHHKSGIISKVRFSHCWPAA
jgi:hypothetical protein